MGFVADIIDSGFEAVGNLIDPVMDTVTSQVVDPVFANVVTPLMENAAPLGFNMMMGNAFGGGSLFGSEGFPDALSFMSDPALALETAIKNTASDYGSLADFLAQEGGSYPGLEDFIISESGGYGYSADVPWYDNLLNQIKANPLKAAQIGGNILASGASLASGLQGTFGKNAPSKLADPFGAYRPQYAAQLNALMSDPSRVTSTPGYAFGMQQGQEALQRKLDKAGMSQSGAERVALQEYGQGYAGQQFQQQLANLMQLSGASQTPAAGQMYSNQLRESAMKDILGGLGGGNVVLGQGTPGIMGGQSTPGIMNTGQQGGIGSALSSLFNTQGWI